MVYRATSDVDYSPLQLKVLKWDRSYHRCYCLFWLMGGDKKEIPLGTINVLTLPTYVSYKNQTYAW